MPQFEYRLKPQGEVLEQYYESRARITLIMGPLGSGKTIQTCQKLFMLMCEQEPNENGIRPSRFYAIRNTYSDLLTTTTKDWLELFRPLGKYSEGSKKPPTHTLDFDLDDGTTVNSELIFLALDRPDSIKKLRGSQATGFWLNETKELNKAVIDMADLRHGRYPSMATGGVDPTWHGMIGDTNAPDDDHWYYNLAEDVKPDDWEFYKQPGGLIKKGDTWIENPLAENVNNLPEGYYRRGKEGKRDDWINVNLANNYGSVQDGKPVYPEYSDSLHCANEEIAPIPGVEIILGWDFGLTPACVIAQVTPRGQLIILDDLVATRMGIRQFSREIVKPLISSKYKGFELAPGQCDPSGVAGADTDMTSCFMELQAAGFQAQPASTNAELPRREAVAGFLTSLVDGKPRLLLSPNCKTLRKGFNGGYRYKRLMVIGDERYKDSPDKDNPFSHPHDALQYICLYVQAPILPQATKSNRKRRKRSWKTA